MISGDNRVRNLQYVQYSRVDDSVTSSSTVMTAGDGTQPTSSSGNAIATSKVIFGHVMTKFIAAAMLIVAIGILAGAITVALTVGDRHSNNGVASLGNESVVATASVSLTTASPSVTTASPSVTTASPSVTTASPSVTTASPSVTTALPSVTTASPSVTTASPSVTTAVKIMTSVSSLVSTTTGELTTSPCQSSEFTCSNLACVSLELVCNGIPDCTDGSDENTSCVCTVGQFQCPSGQCVPSSAVCDQFYDCLDKGDEAVCPDCAGFRCLSNNVCLWDGMSKKCNQVFDCDDYSDELNCESFRARYNCSNGVAVHNSKVCDGLDDCGDNSDEVSCDCKGKRQSPCSDQPGKCILSTWLCDGHPDCHQATDELKCGTCQEGDFQCRDYTCVNNSLRCDGNLDCQLSGGDEDDCVTLTSHDQLQVLLGGRMYPVCSDGWTQAHSTLVCDTLHSSRSLLSSSSVPYTTQFSQFAVLKEPKSAALIGHFVVSDACQSQATVHIQCHDAGCGQRKVGVLESYVAGGNVAADGKWPWVVSLAYLDKPVCGGVLIRARWVLTAAHCVMFAVNGLHDYSKVPFYFTVSTGTVITSGNVSSSDRHQPPAQTVRVSKIYFHPDTSILASGGVDWDIALLLLEEDLTMSDFVQPVCLPSYAQVFAPTSFCYLAGWGILSYRQYLRAGQLRDTRIQLWSESRCSRNTLVGESVVNTNSTICAGYLIGRPSGCQGDSGGPLMCLDPASGRYILAGLVSRGSVECGLSQPNAHSNRFARIAMAVTWIEDILSE